MRKKYLRWGAIAVATALLTQAATPMVFAAPAPSISVTAAATTPYSSVSVSGSGFAPGETVLLIFGRSQATTTADSQGTISSSALTVPNVATGNYVILALGETSGNTAFAYFYVSSFYPQVSPSTWWTAPGTTISFAGSGFAPNESISVSLAGSSTPIAAFSADGNGSFTGQGSFTIPYSLRNSSASFTVTGMGSGVSISFKIGVGDLYPYANPTAWYILPGNSVTFSGGGFGAGENVNVYYGASTTPLMTTTADASGNFMSTTPVMVPYGTGVATFRVVGAASGASITVPITRANFYPTLTPSVYYSAPGGTITLSGSGFVPNEQISIAAGASTTVATTDNTGAFSGASVKLPMTPNTTAPITATGMTSGATANVGIAIGGYYTWINFSAWWIGGGSPLTITGHNFAPGETVTAMSGTQNLGSGTADTMGNVTISGSAPHGVAGPAIVTLTGSVSQTPASATLTIAPVWTSFTIPPYFGAPGSALDLVGSGYQPGELVDITTDKTTGVQKTITADATGSFNDSSFSVPAGISNADLMVTATGEWTGDTKTIDFFVTGN